MIDYVHPYRRPPNCGRHPLHSQPCPMCFRENVSQSEEMEIDLTPRYDEIKEEEEEEK